MSFPAGNRNRISCLSKCGGSNSSINCATMTVCLSALIAAAPVGALCVFLPALHPTAAALVGALCVFLPAVHPTAAALAGALCVFLPAFPLVGAVPAFAAPVSFAA